MRRLYIIVFITLLIITSIVGGVVYFEQPEESHVERRPSHTSTSALESLPALTSSVLKSLLAPVMGPLAVHGEESGKRTATPEVQEFYRIARSELAAGGEIKAAAGYLHGLPAGKQLNVARAIVSDSDARIGYLGASLLIAQGYEDEAVPALATMIASGRDETQLNGRIGYDWVHSDDETLFLRMLINLSRYLLAHLENYKGAERIHVEKFLMGGMFYKSVEPFSRDAAERRISEWEAELRKLRGGSTSQ